MTIHATVIPSASADLSASVDDSTIQFTSGTLKVKDAGIVAAKLATDAVETLKIKDANVTIAKLDPATSTNLLGFFYRNLWAGTKGTPTLEAGYIQAKTTASGAGNSYFSFQDVAGVGFTYKTIDFLCAISNTAECWNYLGLSDNGAVYSGTADSIFIADDGTWKFQTKKTTTATATAITECSAKKSRKIVWALNSCKYYIDGVLTVTHTTNVPAVALNIYAHVANGNAYEGFVKIYQCLVY